MRIAFGRHVFGIVAVAVGVCAVWWHAFDIWEQAQPLTGTPAGMSLSYIAALFLLFGGVAIQWPGSARAGALALLAIYACFVLLMLPAIVRSPQVYNSWGDFFLHLAVASGALLAYASTPPFAGSRTPKLLGIGYYSFSLCVVSFALEQAFYLSMTASLVPTWIPAGQMFWAWATTVAFGLAAVALLADQCAALAASLLTLMLVLFGLLIWVPACLADPHSLGNWAELTQNFAIAGAAWIVADLLQQRSSGKVVFGSLG